jgi:hypothetical protein
MVVPMTTFDTETMAELCVKQGIIEEAIAIYRRLLADARGEVHDRYLARLRNLEGGVGPGSPLSEPLIPSPGPDVPALRVARRGDEVEIEWQLPPAVSAPALQVLLLSRTREGIATEPRTIPVSAARGHTILVGRNLYAVRAAAGRLEGNTFVPLARTSSVI